MTAEGTIHRLVVATDGSPESEHAFAAMMPIVRKDHPEVTVLYVVEDPESPYSSPAGVAKACKALRLSGVDAHLEIREGKAAEVIARRAKNADLLVLSTHGRGGFKRLVLGSVTESVLRLAEVPLLITRPNIAVREWTRMIVALDGSPRGERILEDVIPLARRLQMSVDLIQAVMPPITSSGLGDFGGVQIIENPIPYLEGVKARLSTQGIDARIQALEGRAGAQILKYAEERGSSLLCLSTHGRSGLAHVLLGSIADEVLRQAPCPVLLRRNLPVPA